MSAAALLAEVAAAGAELEVMDRGTLVARGARLPEALVARLRAEKAAILAVLAPPVNRHWAADGSCCRYCGERMPDLRVKPPAVPSPRAWRDAAGAAPGAVMFGDGSAAHARCYGADALRRAGNALSAEALVDEAEVTVRGELL